jgi:hypothetical protein
MILYLPAGLSSSMGPDDWDTRADGGRDIDTVRRRAIDAVRACLEEIGRLAFDSRSSNAGPVALDVEPGTNQDTEAS